MSPVLPFKLPDKSSGTCIVEQLDLQTGSVLRRYANCKDAAVALRVCDRYMRKTLRFNDENDVFKFVGFKWRQCKVEDADSVEYKETPIEALLETGKKSYERTRGNGDRDGGITVERRKQGSKDSKMHCSSDSNPIHLPIGYTDKETKIYYPPNFSKSQLLQLPANARERAKDPVLPFASVIAQERKSVFKPVEQLHYISGNVLRRYASISDAAAAMQVPTSVVSRWLNESESSYYGRKSKWCPNGEVFKWRYCVVATMDMTNYRETPIETLLEMSRGKSVRSTGITQHLASDNDNDADRNRKENEGGGGEGGQQKESSTSNKSMESINTPVLPEGCSMPAKGAKLLVGGVNNQQQQQEAGNNVRKRERTIDHSINNDECKKKQIKKEMIPTMIDNDGKKEGDANLKKMRKE